MENILMIKYKGKTNLVHCDDVVYVKRENRLLVFHTSEENYTTYMKMTEAIEKLGPSYVQIHRSYLIDLNQVRALEGNTVILLNGESLPIGRLYKKDFMNRIVK